MEMPEMKINSFVFYNAFAIATKVVRIFIKSFCNLLLQDDLLEVYEVPCCHECSVPSVVVRHSIIHFPDAIME